MMRSAYFGTNALILMGLHALLFVMDLLGGFAYFRTLFFPMVNFLILMMAVMGAFQRDKVKTPAWIALVLGLGTLIFWVVALAIRLSNP